MGTRTLAQVQPTAGEVALNAYIHGYGGHSLVTPHAALKQLWWTDERIEAKVNKRFVLSKLCGEERAFLNRPLAYGEGLTDGTYLDWILARSKRLFLVLSQIGAADQIFGCIDDSWSDDDLPIRWEDVPSLELSYDNDPALNHRFYKTQFTFLLRQLKESLHLEYGPQEHIPLEYVNTLPPAVNLQSWDRIHFPGDTDKTFVRRKFAFEQDAERYKAFLRDVRRAQHLPHQHIAKVWATYVSDDHGYVISDFVPEHTLQTFVDHRTPMQLIRLPAEQRPIVLCEWMHCLADAVAYLHHNGLVHGSIKPSNIIVDSDNKIAFADIGAIRTFQQSKRLVKDETHNYAAPETCKSIRSVVLPSSSPSKGHRFRLSRLRKLSISTSSSTSSESHDSGYSSISPSRPASSTLTQLMREDSLFTMFTPIDSWSVVSTGAPPSFTISRSPSGDSARSRLAPTILPQPSRIDPATLRDLPVAEPEMTDIYTLGCVFLDIVTFVMRGKLNDFIKFRTSKGSSPEGKPTPDASFHANAGKLDEWIDMLEEESLQYGEAIYRGIPDMLRLIKRMLMQNATMRPTACQVRDRMSDILALTCGVEELCCADRVWPCSGH